MYGITDKERAAARKIMGARAGISKDDLDLALSIMSGEDKAELFDRNNGQVVKPPSRPLAEKTIYSPGKYGQMALEEARRVPHQLTDEERREREGFIGYVHDNVMSLKDGISATAELAKNGLDQNHENRNYYNHVPATLAVIKDGNWVKLPRDEGVFHRFAANAQFNDKYVSPDGHHEVIFDHNGNLVKDPRNMGTFNYTSPQHNIEHFWDDVLPYYLYGNSSKDNTSMAQRLIKTLESVGMPHDFLLTDPNK